MTTRTFIDTAEMRKKAPGQEYVLVIFNTGSWEVMLERDAETHVDDEGFVNYIPVAQIIDETVDLIK